MSIVKNQYFFMIALTCVLLFAVKKMPSMGKIFNKKMNYKNKFNKIKLNKSNDYYILYYLISQSNNLI